MATWNEELHPRAPRGAPGGGRWIPAGGWELDDDDRAEIARYREYGPTPNRMPENVKPTAKEAEAIKNYAGTGVSVRLNKQIRSGAELASKQSVTKQGLDAMMKRSVLAQDTLLYRYYGVATGSSFANKFKDMKPGDSFVDKGFMSTSYTPSNEDNLIKILAPKGTRGIVVPMDLDFENEVILDRNSRLEYIGEDPNDGSKYFRLLQDERPSDEPDEKRPTKSPDDIMKTVAERLSKMPKSDDVSGLRHHLMVMAEFNKAQFPGGKDPASFMLEHGKDFKFDESSYKGKRGRVHGCYENSGNRAIEDPNVTYVEGYVSVHGVPLEHAWLVDKQGHVIDPTIKNSEDISGYFGIPIKTSYLSKTILRTEKWGVLDWMNIQQVLKDDPKGIVADYTKGGGGVRSKKSERPSDEDQVRKKEKKRKFLGIHEPTKEELQGMVSRVKRLVVPIAKKLKFNPDDFVFHTTRSWLMAGYDRWTGKIDFWRGSLGERHSPKVIQSTAAHEIQHHKYVVVQQSLESDRKKSPIYALMDRHWSKDNIAKLKAAGGVSSYSDQYWKEVAKAEQRGDEIDIERETEAAIDETLAEIAAAEIYPERRIPAVWQEFYDDLNKAYIKLGGAKAQTYGQTVAPLIEADNAKIKAEQKKLRDEIKATVRGVPRRGG